MNPAPLLNNLLGYGLCRAWIIEHMAFARQAHIYPENYAVLVLYGALALAGLLCVLFPHAKQRSSTNVRTLSIILAAVGFLGTGAVIIGGLGQSIWYFFVGEILVGLCGGFFEVKWYLLFVRLATKRSYLNLLLAILVASACGLICSFIPVSAFYITSLLLLGASAFLYSRTSDQPNMSSESRDVIETKPDKTNMGSMRRLIVTCFLYCTAHMCATTLGYNSLDANVIYQARLFANFMTVAILLVHFLVSQRTATSSLIKTIVPLTALGLFIQASGIESVRPIALVVLCVSNKLFDIFVLIRIIELAKDGPVMPHRCFGALVFAKNFASVVGSIVCLAILDLVDQGAFDLTTLAFILVMLVTVALLWVVPEKPELPTAIGETATAEPSHNLLDIAAEAGLTPRETDVFLLLSRGKNRASIADALCISRSTVHAHTIKIYQKLGIHDQQELILLAEQADTPSAPYGEIYQNTR